jgi:hypothetical protein
MGHENNLSKSQISANKKAKIWFETNNKKIRSGKFPTTVDLFLQFIKTSFGIELGSTTPTDKTNFFCAIEASTPFLNELGYNGLHVSSIHWKQKIYTNIDPDEAHRMPVIYSLDTKMIENCQEIIPDETLKQKMVQKVVDLYEDVKLFRVLEKLPDGRSIVQPLLF